jgi:small conductance mechanosensitive channel
VVLSALTTAPLGLLASLAQEVGETPDLDEALPEGGIAAEDWVRAGVILLVFVIIGIVIQRVVQRVIGRTDSEGQIAHFVGRVTRNLVVLVGFVYALNDLGVSIGPLVGALGITGIAIAFALTAILENVFASVVLKTRRPIKVGDQVSTHEHDGTVEEINFRTVVLRNFDGEKVVIPSAMVNNEVMVNHTDRPTRRTVLPVGVAYGTDLPHAQSVILRATQGVQGVLEAPAPQAWVTTFNESSIDFDVRYWHESDILTMFRVRSGVAMAIKTAFDAEGIEIPFPQRVVTLPEGASNDRESTTDARIDG